MIWGLLLLTSAVCGAAIVRLVDLIRNKHAAPVPVAMEHASQQMQLLHELIDELKASQHDSGALVEELRSSHAAGGGQGDSNLMREMIELLVVQVRANESYVNQISQMQKELHQTLASMQANQRAGAAPAGYQPAGAMPARALPSGSLPAGAIPAEGMSRGGAPPADRPVIATPDDSMHWPQGSAPYVAPSAGFEWRDDRLRHSAASRFEPPQPNEAPFWQPPEGYVRQAAVVGAAYPPSGYDLALQTPVAAGELRQGLAAVEHDAWASALTASDPSDRFGTPLAVSLGGQPTNQRAYVLRQAKPQRSQEKYQPYPATEQYAPYRSGRLPLTSELKAMRCHDIGESGLSFFLEFEPDFESLVIRLSTDDKEIDLTARVVEWTPWGENPTDPFLVRCQFTGRVYL